MVNFGSNSVVERFSEFTKDTYYWWVIRPDSGLIRHCMLPAIRQEAVRGTT